MKRVQRKELYTFENRKNNKNGRIYLIINILIIFCNFSLFSSVRLLA